VAEMKTAIEMFVPQNECSGRCWLKWYQRWRVDFFCWLLGHSLWRIHGSVVENPTDSGWTYYATICLRCGRGGYMKQDYYNNK